MRSEVPAAVRLSVDLSQLSCLVRIVLALKSCIYTGIHIYIIIHLEPQQAIHNLNTTLKICLHLIYEDQAHLQFIEITVQFSRIPSPGSMYPSLKYCMIHIMKRGRTISDIKRRSRGIEGTFSPVLNRCRLQNLSKHKTRPAMFRTTYKVQQWLCTCRILQRNIKMSHLYA